MLRIKELNLTCMINDSERITEKLGQSLVKTYLVSLKRDKKCNQIEFE